MTINLDFKTAVIVLLTLCLLFVGAYFYRGVQTEKMAAKFEQTQALLVQLNFPPTVAQALEQIGWRVKEQPAPILPQEEE